MLVPHSPRAPKDQLQLLPLIEHESDENNEKLSALLDQSPDLLQATFCDSEAPPFRYSILHYAAQKGNISACKILLDAGADSSHGSESAIFGAIRSGNPDIVLLMIDKKFALNGKSSIPPHNRPLHLAAELGVVDVINVLLKSGANQSLRNGSRLKPFQCTTNADIQDLLNDEKVPKKAAVEEYLNNSCEHDSLLPQVEERPASAPVPSARNMSQSFINSLPNIFGMRK